MEDGGIPAFLVRRRSSVGRCDEVNARSTDSRLSDQLYRAVGSVSANIGEGYSRGTGKDRSRFYSYALGSGREGRDWYYKGRHVLGESVTDHRLDLMTQIIRILLVMIPDQRGESLREGEAVYGDLSASELAT